TQQHRPTERGSAPRRRLPGRQRGDARRRRGGLFLVGRFRLLCFAIAALLSFGQPGPPSISESARACRRRRWPPPNLIYQFPASRLDEFSSRFLSVSGERSSSRSPTACRGPVTGGSSAIPRVT